MNQDEPIRNKVPNPEVWPRAQRRRFSAEYKLRILEEAGASSGSGQIGALLRREGLYSSHLTTWRRQRAQGQLDGLSPKTRGRKPSVFRSGSRRPDRDSLCFWEGKVLPEPRRKRAIDKTDCGSRIREVNWAHVAMPEHPPGRSTQSH